jgi:hypothetical protein
MDSCEGTSPSAAQRGAFPHRPPTLGSSSSSLVNGVRRHAEPLGDNDPPQLCQRDAEYGYRNIFRVLGTRSARQ